MVTQSVILHVNSDKVVETRSRKAQDAGYLLGVEKVGSLVPVNPHAAKIVAQEVVERVARKEGKAVRNPVGLVWVVVVVALCSLAQVANGLGPLLVGAGPDAEADTI